MCKRKVRVALNGYDPVGERIAAAIMAQDDMELVGVADTDAGHLIAAIQKGYSVYVSDQARSYGGPGGTFDELLACAEVVVDNAPASNARFNLNVYSRGGVKAVFHCNARHDEIGHSFVAQSNYASALGREATRVASCDTTSTVRVLGALQIAGLLKKARGVIIRQPMGPVECGIVTDAFHTDKHIPSSQGLEAQTVAPDLDVLTVTVIAACTTSHTHIWDIELSRPATRDDALAVFRAAPRIAVLKADLGMPILNSTLYLYSRTGSAQGDLWEVGLWEDSLTVLGNELFVSYQVHHCATTVPETIDAIRALSGVEADAATSIARTDQALGMVGEMAVNADGAVSSSQLWVHHRPGRSLGDYEVDYTLHSGGEFVI